MNARVNWTGGWVGKGAGMRFVGCMLGREVVLWDVGARVAEHIQR